MKTICIVIPCLNEEKALRSNLPRLMRHLQTLHSRRWHIVVVDNGSTDATQAVVRELSAAYTGLSLLVQPERGRGNAIRLAWTISAADVLAYMDADLAVGLAHISDLVEPILNDRADVVYGNRFAPTSIVQRTWFREILSQGYRLIARALVGTAIQDFQCGFKAIDARCRDELLGNVRNGQWFFDTELLVLSSVQGMRVLSMPVVWSDRDETRVRFIQTIWSDIVLLFGLRRRLAKTLALDKRLGKPEIASKALSGFTLVELLVTIAIITVLAALIFPAISKTRDKSRRIPCLNHLRQLQLAYLSYTDDNNQLLPRNGARQDANGSWRSLTNTWCGPSATRADADTSALRAGVIFSYIGNDRVYHCPSDQSRIEWTGSGDAPLRTRSYALNGALRGYTNEWYRMVRRLSEVAAPAAVMAFIDEHESTIDDGHFMIHLPPSVAAPNLPSRRHGPNAPVSFLDGHCEAIAFGDDAKVLQRYTIPRE